MVYCTNCGMENASTDNHCGNCGASLGQRQSKWNDKPIAEQVGRIGFVSPGTVAQRSYWMYMAPSIIGSTWTLVALAMIFINYDLEDIRLELFLSVVPGILLAGLGGLILIIYYYFNFDDLRELTRRYHPNIYPEPYAPWLMIVTYFMFSPAMYYFKYQQLRQHLTEVHEHEPSPSPWIFFAVSYAPSLIIPMIIFSLERPENLFFPVVIIGLIGIMIVCCYLYLEYSWQKKFNEHVKWHERNHQLA